MFEWSDDDENSVAAPPSTEAPPRNMRVEEQLKGGEEVPEQRARRVPAQQVMGASAQQATGVPEQQAEEVPERRADQRPTVEEAAPPPKSTGVDPMTAPRGSSGQRRFMKLYRQTKP